MDNKFYVSLEAARLLKEKGYNEVCDCTIDDDGDIFECQYQMNQDLPKWEWSCPTKSEAIDWLESKEVYIQIGGIGSGETQKWSYSVFDYRTCDDYASEYIFPTRLQAEEAAIIKALGLLKGKEE